MKIFFLYDIFSLSLQKVFTKKYYINILTHKYMNKISHFIQEKIEKTFSIKFKPTRDFYTRVGIGQRRFQMLLRNEVTPNYDEMLKLAKYFNLQSYTELMEQPETTIN